MELQRTTVRITKPLFKTVKKLTVEKEISFQEIISQALINYLTNLDKGQEIRSEKFKFADKNMGHKLDRPLTRKDLY